MLRRVILCILVLILGCAGGKTRPGKPLVNEAVPAQLIATDLYDAENLAFDPLGRLFVSAADGLYMITGLGKGGDAPAVYKAVDLDAVFAGMAMGPDGFLYVVCYHKMKTKILRVDLNRDGFPYTIYLEGVIRSPNGMRFDDAGVLYAADFGYYGPRVGRILKIEPDPARPDRAGAVTPLVTGLWGPNGIVIDRDRDRLYFTETFAGKVYYLEGKSGGGFRKEPKLLLNADTHGPRFPILDDLALDARGNLYICNYNENRILVVSPDGDIVRSLAPSGMKHPTAVAFGMLPGDQESLYVTQKGHMFVNERRAGDRVSRVENVARPYRLPFLVPPERTSVPGSPGPDQGGE